MSIRFNLKINRETRQAITNRMPLRDLMVTKDGLATEACIRDWLWTWMLDKIDDEARIDECVALDCLDTDEDHDHADGPKR